MATPSSLKYPLPPVALPQLPAFQQKAQPLAANLLEAHVIYKLTDRDFTIAFVTSKINSKESQIVE